MGTTSIKRFLNGKTTPFIDRRSAFRCTQEEKTIRRSTPPSWCFFFVFFSYGCLFFRPEIPIISACLDDPSPNLCRRINLEKGISTIRARTHTPAPRGVSPPKRALRDTRRLRSRAPNAVKGARKTHTYLELPLHPGGGAKKKKRLLGKKIQALSLRTIQTVSLPLSGQSRASTTTSPKVDGTRVLKQSRHARDRCLAPG